MWAAIPNGTVNPPYDEVGECIHLGTSEKLRSSLMRKLGAVSCGWCYNLLMAMPFISPTDNHILRMRRGIVNGGIINQAIMTYRMNQSDRVIYSFYWVSLLIHRQILNSELMNLRLSEYVLNTLPPSVIFPENSLY